MSLDRYEHVLVVSRPATRSAQPAPPRVTATALATTRQIVNEATAAPASRRSGRRTLIGAGVVVAIAAAVAATIAFSGDSETAEPTTGGGALPAQQASWLDNYSPSKWLRKAYRLDDQGALREAETICRDLGTDTSDDAAVASLTTRISTAQQPLLPTEARALVSSVRASGICETYQ